VVVHNINTTSVVLGAATHDRVHQRIVGQQVLMDDTGLRFAPAVLRYVWPSELDLMARLAGMRLRSRSGGWKEEPFTSASARHVSVYELGT
jgi:hypothetical protein